MKSSNTKWPLIALALTWGWASVGCKSRMEITASESPKELFRITSGGNLFVNDPTLQAAIDKECAKAYARGVNDALTTIALHDLERKMNFSMGTPEQQAEAATPLTWGDRGEIVAKRLHVERTK